ncbi:PREDICTED: polyadenylate-binding protein-interacting protein 11-like isoform X2 [Populus euphratica]|uniref:Polyadenylate-binding protein-interacting protein 11-like isoform X2 n=1 Tax=Populus euphratica TaxID=75702 RepID=A0AAJ6UYL0_POPEU|nr:PREDICTED: polyadenylate-binding protein-interacting protein 11-like isoform X2 [Populus euphratica]
MAVGENVSVDLGNFRAESSVSSSSNEQDHHIHNNNALIQPLYLKVSQVGHHQVPYNHHHQQRSNGGESYKREIRELQELFSKLNPMAAEFVPPSLSNNNSFGTVNGLNGVNGGFYGNSSSSSSNNNLVVNGNGFDRNGQVNGNAARRKKNYGQVKRRISSRTSMAQREDTVRRTVYVSDIDQQVTEEQLAALFINCGQVVDCRICGDPNSVLHFAFIEFTDEEGARAALSLSGTMLGYYPVKVLPSKTAIAPVNHTFLPRVYRLRLLGDHHHPTRIAFVEFVMAESAIAALNCSGAVIGSLPIRVSPSKTPVRPRGPRVSVL